jgi:hypothetical protein
MAGHVATVQFSRAVREGGPPSRAIKRILRDTGRRPCRSLKTQQHAPARAPRYVALAGPGSVDVLGHSGVADVAGGRDSRSQPATPARFRVGTDVVLPRKEVIQPHLPVRLPCYDFTPVTSPTFDGSLPCGLGHRLRVLLTPVV